METMLQILVVLLVSFEHYDCQKMLGNSTKGRIVMVPPGIMAPLDQFRTPTPGNATYMALEFTEQTSGTLLEIELGVNLNVTANSREDAPVLVQLWQRVKTTSRGRAWDEPGPHKPDPERWWTTRFPEWSMPLPETQGISEEDMYIFTLVEQIPVNKSDVKPGGLIKLDDKLSHKRGKSEVQWCLIVRPGDWLAIYIPGNGSPIQVPHTQGDGIFTLAAKIVRPSLPTMGSSRTPGMSQMTFLKTHYHMNFPIRAKIYHDAGRSYPDGMKYAKCPVLGTARVLLVTTEPNIPKESSSFEKESSSTGMYAAIGVISTIALIAIVISIIVCFRYKKQKQTTLRAQRTDSTVPMDVDNRHRPLGRAEGIMQHPAGFKMQRNSVYGLKCKVTPSGSVDSGVSYIVISEDLISSSGDYEDIKNILTRQNSAADPDAPQPPERMISIESNSSGSKQHTYLILLPDNDSGIIDINSTGSESSSGRDSMLTSESESSSGRGSRLASDSDSSSGISSRLELENESSSGRGSRLTSESESSSGKYSKPSSISDSDHGYSKSGSRSSSIKHSALRQQESGPYWKIED